MCEPATILETIADRSAAVLRLVRMSADSSVTCWIDQDDQHAH